LFSVLYAFWLVNHTNGDAMRDLAAHFLVRAQRVTVPLMIGHRMMGVSLVRMGHIAEGRAHFDQAMALYEPAEHRPLSTRFDNMPRQPPTPKSLSLLPRKNVSCLEGPRNDEPG